ncbi:DUF6075 family protein [Clostridium sp. LQ25]|uniref:DUF6075 family protein n=1 Tax=Clostridium sp. LQ25 TaxID=2992805 RepID=UPI00225C19ED|nr:DUF6075 family protein [Clostridium sp. LQ25]UZT06175.1 DUF6075 family protein [Clostridium sp. LQ25]
MMAYLNEEHEERYKVLIKKLGLNYEDRERKALFYLVAGNLDLYKQLDKIYDFKNQQLCCLTEDGQLDFSNIYTSSSSKALLRLGIQLYNSGDDITVSETFRYLDADTAQIALNAIKIRYKIN